MNKTVLAHLAATVAALSAGTAVVATRFVVGETDPAALVLYRYAVAVLCFAPALVFIWPKHAVPVADYARIAAFGILFFGLFPWAFNASLQYIPAARGAVGLATVPIQTLIVAALFGREAFTLPKMLGVILAFTGIAVVFGPEALAINGPLSETLIGDGLMLLGAFCAALYSVFSRATLARHGPLFVTALAMICAVVAFVPLVAYQQNGIAVPTFSREGWLAVLFLGTFAGAVQFSLFTWALRWLPPTTTVLYLTLNPLTATLLGVLLIGETLTLPLVIGLALVVSGILVGNGVYSAVFKVPRKAS